MSELGLNRDGTYTVVEMKRDLAILDGARQVMDEAVRRQDWGNVCGHAAYAIGAGRIALNAMIYHTEARAQEIGEALIETVEREDLARLGAITELVISAGELLTDTMDCGQIDDDTQQQWDRLRAALAPFDRLAAEAIGQENE